MTLPAPTVPEPQRVVRITPGDLPADTLRVIVFGPGKGETITVQLPDGRVGVVDGCREPHEPHGRLDTAIRTRILAASARAAAR